MSVEDLLFDEAVAVDQIGCMNFGAQSCPARRKLRELRRLAGQSESAPITKEDVDFLQEFAISDKFCGRCREVAYCSKGCQKADWPDHRAVCTNARLIRAHCKETRTIAKQRFEEIEEWRLDGEPPGVIKDLKRRLAERNCTLELEDTNWNNPGTQSALLAAAKFLDKRN